MSVETLYKSTVQVKEETVGFSKKKQIGLFGGTFNPIHQGHLVVAQTVCDTLGIERIDFLPSFLPPHVDPKKTIDPKHRVKMLELAISGNEKFAIEKEEIFRKGKSYTIDTINALQKKHPENDYFFIIGGDMVEYLPKWKDIDQLIKKVSFVGVNRPNYQGDSLYPILFVDVPQLNISSTMIRQRVKIGCPPRYLLPDNVLDYIEEMGLYHE